MKPTRLLLHWLGALLGLGILLGTAAALQVKVPDTLHSVVWGLLLALLLLAMLDAVRLRRRPSPRAQRQMPGSLALGRWGEVRLVLEHDFPQPLTVQVFDHVPDGLTVENLPQSIDLRPGERSELGYRLRPLRRGHFTFSRCEIHLPSPMGLWSARRFIEVRDAIRVYPDFARLYGAQLLGVDNWLSQLGVRQRQRRGLGLEFHQLREFRDGDSLRQIDWKATARQRTPIAREYQDERDQQIVFMLDCGRRMRSQDDELSHFDHALNACLLLSYVALREGDAVGLCTFAGDQPRYLAPVKGSSQLNLLLNAVYDLDTTRRTADYQAAASQLLARQKRRALVVVVTNLRDEDDEALLTAVKRISRQHRVLVASLREEVLDQLRQAPVQTLPEALAYSGTVGYLNTRDELHERLSAQGLSVLDTLPSELGPALVTRYLGWKKAGAF
ncbi:DUF58 domain-containing protein [Pseudomonas lurida]|uniref:DUF58 domain-containing protein n=1 Tax=Pseudomonas lurida TaxID=244566 RepID=UPI000BFA6AC9|nr:DUF58 domain-containing protein [Pseudomonas lurida]VVP78535.1 hypothetical protein PS907_03255 [Pseudomonas fluorescens]MBC3924821.1 DUF58 domain-containing protein [Pseudomonas lurida]MBD8669307.1 DUF58 domain-containing protein [Pseudomonas lurida]PFG25819.1 uncharacterized protein (DUF58 family) [Pseudomonas lurida]UZQ73090.1 DUF58 domain-containing protein [Pseudomonas lurida]